MNRFSDVEHPNYIVKFDLSHALLVYMYRENDDVTIGKIIALVI